MKAVTQQELWAIILAADSLRFAQREYMAHRETALGRVFTAADAGVYAAEREELGWAVAAAALAYDKLRATVLS